MTVDFCIIGEDHEISVQLAGRHRSNGLLTLRSEPGYAVVLLGRLHYREDLRAALDPRRGDPARLDDAGLVLEAYRQHGLAGLERLEGTFAVAVWDARAGILTGRRDLLGGFPLFSARSGRRTALGTSLEAVRRWVGADELDPDYLADYHLLSCFAENEPRSERTAFRGVERVRAGTLIRIEIPTARVQTRPHWDWLELLDDPGTDRVDEIARGYLDRLRGAVRQRLWGKTAAHLSGGMDSTSVALLTLEALDEGQGPLATISLVYDGMRVLARERPLIEGLARERAGLEPYFIVGDGLLNFDSYADPIAHDEPWPWLSTAEIEAARVEVAARAGVATVLTGQGADELLDTGPYQIADHLRRGRLRRAWAEACQCARAENCSVWSIFGPFGLLPLLPAKATDGLGPLVRGGVAPWEKMGETTVPPWIRPEFARRQRLRDRAVDQVRRTYHGSCPTVLSVALAKVEARVGDLGRYYLSAPRGILTEHPFLDPRLISYSLGIHARIDPPPRTTPKPILGAAMREILPEEIRTRPKAGFFNEPYFRGVSRHLPRLEALVSAAPSDVDDWIDRRVLIECLRRSALGIGNLRIQMDRLNLTL
jgi:asparagine synthase (glutamine-hydrolysing)